MMAGEKYSQPIGNELSNAAERILEIMFIMEAYDGQWVSQQGLRLWLNGLWSSHRIKIMRDLRAWGYIDKTEAAGINLYTLTDECKLSIKARKENALLWRTPQRLIDLFGQQKAVSK